MKYAYCLSSPFQGVAADPRCQTPSLLDFRDDRLKRALTHQESYCGYTDGRTMS